MFGRKKYFKDGCPYCGSKIVCVEATKVGNKDPDRKAYVCSNYFKDSEGYEVESIDDELRMCSAYTLAHAKNDKVNNEDKPLGVLSDHNLRKLHIEANRSFLRIWKETIINHIWEYIVSYTYDNGDITFAKRLAKDGEDKTFIKFLNTDITDSVENDRLRTISARTKSYLWLATEMGYPFEGFSIQNLNSDETVRAMNIINQTLKDYENNSG